jgi:hypothetical protein
VQDLLVILLAIGEDLPDLLLELSGGGKLTTHIPKAASQGMEYN